MSETKSPTDDLPREGERVFYIRDDRGQPVGCIAYRSQSGVVSYAASFLHPNDAFDRRRARLIALGRLRVNPLAEVVLLDDERPLSMVLSQIVRRADTPSRAKKSLRRGMKRRSRGQG